MFCNRTGTTPGWGPVDTPDCHHPKCQESKREGCRVAYKECGRNQLDLHKTLVYIYILYAFQKLVCSGACLRTKNQSSLQSLLRASVYGTSVSGTDWLLFTVLSHFNFLHHFYFLVYCFFLSHLIGFFFQVNFLAWLLCKLDYLTNLHHRLWAFAKKPRSWICAEEAREAGVVTANTLPPLSVKHYQNEWGMFMLCEYLLRTWRTNFCCVVFCSWQL